MSNKPEINWAEGMERPATVARGNDDVARLIIAVQEAHAAKCDQLRLITSNPDKGLQFGDDEDSVNIEAGTKLHKGVIIGVRLALQHLEQFPIEVKERAPKPDLDPDVYWEDDE